jgi:hypothetical protein
LLQAEGVLEFLFEELAEQDNSMSNLMLVQLKVEIGKEHDKSLVYLLRFLVYPNSLTNQTVDPFFAMSYKPKSSKRQRHTCNVFTASSNPMISVNR